MWNSSILVLIYLLNVSSTSPSVTHSELPGKKQRAYSFGRGFVTFANNDLLLKFICALMILCVFTCP